MGKKVWYRWIPMIEYYKVTDLLTEYTPFRPYRSHYDEEYWHERLYTTTPSTTTTPASTTFAPDEIETMETRRNAIIARLFLDPIITIIALFVIVLSIVYVWRIRSSIKRTNLWESDYKKLHPQCSELDAGYANFWPTGLLKVIHWVLPAFLFIFKISTAFCFVVFLYRWISYIKTARFRNENLNDAPNNSNKGLGSDIKLDSFFCLLGISFYLVWWNSESSHGTVLTKRQSRYSINRRRELAYSDYFTLNISVSWDPMGKSPNQDYGLQLAKVVRKLFLHAFESVIDQPITELIELELRSDTAQSARFQWVVDIMPTDHISAAVIFRRKFAHCGLDCVRVARWHRSGQPKSDLDNPKSKSSGDESSAQGTFQLNVGRLFVCRKFTSDAEDLHGKNDDWCVLVGPALGEARSALEPAHGERAATESETPAERAFFSNLLPALHPVT
ncbi:hypothetical protein Ddc_18654 [Ditylenchus destructor]|nr:hypothetical protein Ddc_18654 [Ditylenchus destructor]